MNMPQICVVRARGVRGAWTALLIALLVTLAAVGSIGAQSTSRMSATVVAQTPTSKTPSQDPLNRLVTVHVHDVTLEVGLREVVRQANLKLFYLADEVPVRQVVSLDVTRVPARAALERLLHGTDIVVRVGEDGQPILTRRDTTSHTDNRVTGQVLDSATGKPVTNASVHIAKTKLSTVTSADGRFTIVDAPTGRRILEVRLIGYRPYSRPIDVPERGVVIVPIILTPTPTVLTGVVTTVTGTQRKLEVGNDITVLNVDSITKVADIHNVSDLLATRVPGLIVTRGGGEVGATSRIRIRGINSVSLSNDPIVIVDGIRAQGLNSSGSNDVIGLAFTSRLDDIDPSTIATIEVIKGPSASTLYGTDAANGVIVITTKRGTPGTSRLTVSGNQRWTSIPGSFPVQYTPWGRTSDSDDPMGCAAYLIALGYCAFQDSLIRYSALDDPRHTTMGTGTASTYGMSYSMGSRTLQAFFSASLSEQTGATQLPPAEKQRILDAKGYIPSWTLRPNTQNGVALQSNFSLQPTPRVDLGIQTAGTHQTTLNGGNGILSGVNVAISDTAGFMAGTSLLTRKSEEVNRGRIGGTGTIRPTDWMTFSGTAGADLSVANQDQWQRAEDCIGSCANATGSRLIGRTIGTAYTLSTNGSITTPLSRRLRLTSAIGFQYSKTGSDQQAVQGIQMPVGMSQPSRAPTQRVFGVTNVTASVGMYWEERMAFAERLFLTGALRRDAGSAFGDSISAPIYPKVDASWVAVNSPIELPVLSAINMVRLRLAYGQSGVQPAAGGKAAQYTSSRAWVDGKVMPSFLFSSVGNALLEPERSGELETGMDVTLVDSRADLSMTYFRRRSRQAIIQQTLAPSIGVITVGTAQRQENVGSVQNAGYSISLSLRVIDRPILGWTVTASTAHTENKLLTLGPNVSAVTAPGDARLVPGYPVFGRWLKPVLGYADLNGDGFIRPNEVLIGDSVEYAGWVQPKYTVSYTSSMSFLRGRVTFTSSFDSQSGLSEANGANLTQGLNDADASFVVQAVYMAQSKTQLVSMFRWNSADVSVTLPTKLVRTIHASSGTISATGSNLGIWSNYHGKDPSVSNPRNELQMDSGIMPSTRDWALRVNLNF